MRAKILWAKPDIEPELLEKLVQGFSKDGITAVGQLSFLKAQDLTARYEVPFFIALELAQKFQTIGNNKMVHISSVKLPLQ